MKNAADDGLARAIFSMISGDAYPNDTSRRLSRMHLMRSSKPGEPAPIMHGLCPLQEGRISDIPGKVQATEYLFSFHMETRLPEQSLPGLIRQVADTGTGRVCPQSAGHRSEAAG